MESMQLKTKLGSTIKMNIKITEDKRNDLFARNEIVAELESKTSPKKQKISELISKKSGKSVDDIVVKKIAGRFGSERFIITANIYNSKEAKEKNEPKKKEKKGAGN